MSENIEQRSQFSVPDVTVVVTGPMPNLLSDRMRYSLRVVWGDQDNKDTFRSIFRNDSGNKE